MCQTFSITTAMQRRIAVYGHSLAEAPCPHGDLVGSLDSAMPQSNRYSMCLHGVEYTISLRMDPNVQNGEHPALTVGIRSDRPSDQCQAMFTSYYGGLFGYVVKTITGEDVMVMWSSPRELCALINIVRSQVKIPLHLVECVALVVLDCKPVTVVRLSYESMELLQAPAARQLVMPRMSLSHEYVCELMPEDSSCAVEQVSLQCKVLRGGGLVLHGIALTPWTQGPRSTMGRSGTCLVFSPRRVGLAPQYSGVIGPPPIVWGSEKRDIPSCRLGSMQRWRLLGTIV